MSKTDALSVEVVKHDDGVVVSLVGSASMDLCERLNAALLDVCQTKPRVLVIDLARLDFICSLGLGCIVVAYLRVTKHGGKLMLANPQPTINDMLTTTKLGGLMPVCSSIEEALARR